ncbi:MAG: hypothetical protein ABFC77_05775 [Thermoguttaceae bacterium]
MPIKIQYGNPGNTLIAAYAGGQNRANNRRASEILKYLQQQQQRQLEVSRQMRHEQFATEQQDRTFAQQRSLFGLEQGQRFQQQQQIANAKAQSRGEPLPFPDLATPANQPTAITDQRGRFSFTGQTTTVGQPQQPGGTMTPFQQRQTLQDRQFQQQSDLGDQRFISEGLRSGHLEYTPAQEQRLAGLQNSVSKVLDDQTLSEGQREIALNELNRRIRSIRPVPKRADKQPRPIADQVKENVHWDGGEWGKGTPWIIDPKTGMPQVPRGWSAPKPEGDDGAKLQAEQSKQQLALQHSKATYAAKLMSLHDANYNPLYTSDQAWEEAERRFGSTAPQGGTTQQPGQPAQRDQQAPTEDPRQSQLRAINEEIESLVSLGDSRTPEETRRMMALRGQEKELLGVPATAAPVLGSGRPVGGSPIRTQQPSSAEQPNGGASLQTVTTPRGMAELVGSGLGLPGPGRPSSSNGYVDQNGAQWGTPRDSMVPLDSQGRGPVRVIATNPPVYVMADGTEIRGSWKNTGVLHELNVNPSAPRQGAGLQDDPTLQPQQPTVRNDDDWRQLPSGATFIGPDGRRYRKK